MKKASYSLILLVFITFSTSAFAQDVQISPRKNAPTGLISDSRSFTRLPLEQWDDRNQHIKDHLNPLTTVPFYYSSNLEIEIGAAFFVTIPF
ncbi:MAG: hypothetical protein Q7T03_07455 [Deltaproteobacteria bacterium]|nr:hypothetical protein [Deltaproteobacteria bacterium]